MLEIKPNLYSVGVQDPGLRVFDIIMNTPHGTSYNAYLLVGSEKSALIETVKMSFAEEYFANIEAIKPISEIDYLIINHTEPDHAGTIPLLLQKNPDITIVGTNSGITFVSSIIKGAFNSRVVGKGGTLSLGDRELEFYPMPNLHWPDTMFTFDPVHKALFTCDFLGTHYAFPELLLSRMTDTTAYVAAREAYYLDIMSPFSRPFAANGLKCARELNPDIILPGHGPILDTGIEEVFEHYEQLTLPPPQEGKNVVIVYVSAYGYTAKLAETIAQGIQDKGVQVTLLDPGTASQREIMQKMQQADGILFGSPTILGKQLQPIDEVLDKLYPFMMKGKLASAFGSYGWSGEAVPNLMDRLGHLKAKTVEGFRVRFRPGEEELQQAHAFGESFAEALK